MSAMTERLTDAMAVLPDFGDNLHAVEVRSRAVAQPRNHISADVQVSVFADGEVCEGYADKILTRHPTATIDRHESGSFSITCAGTPSWSVYFSDSVCERVQVGTKTTLKPAPDAPMVEVEEPVYEWRCADPILAALKSVEGAA